MLAIINQQTLAIVFCAAMFGGVGLLLLIKQWYFGSDDE